MIVLYIWTLAGIACGAITALKGKWGVFGAGFLFGIAWVLGAFRLANPDSWWAQRFYSEETRERARARHEDPKYQERVKIVLLGAVITVVLVSLVGFFGGFKMYRIPSASMEPTLVCSVINDDGFGNGCSGGASDRVLAIRYTLGRKPERGDIAAFHTPQRAVVETCSSGGTFVQRIVGLPGERIRISNGTVYVNGQPLDEPYIETPGDYSTPVELTVPASDYYVLGDNRDQSCDSRVWGSLPRDNLIGEVVWRYWPLSRFGGLD